MSLVATVVENSSRPVTLAGVSMLTAVVRSLLTLFVASMLILNWLSDSAALTSESVGIPVAVVIAAVDGAVAVVMSAVDGAVAKSSFA